MTFTRTGKQILKNGHHFADGSNEEAAKHMIEALQLRGLIEHHFANLEAVGKVMGERG